MTLSLAITNARGFLGEQLCRDALTLGYKVFGLVPGDISSPRNIDGVTYLSMSLFPEAQDHLIQKLESTQCVIDAAGPYTLDTSLFEEHHRFLHTQKSTDPSSADFCIALQDFYSRVSQETVSLCLRLPNINHFIGISSFQVGYQIPVPKNALLRRQKDSGLVLEEKKILDFAPSKNFRIRNPDQPDEHPLGHSAQKYERLIEGSQGWQNKNILKTVLRLGNLIGDSTTGRYPNLRGIYSLVPFCHLLARGSLLLNKLPVLPLPFSEHSRLSLMPVDIASRAILGFCQTSYLNLRQSLNDTSGVAYRHITLSDRDISVRRLFAATLRHLGIEAMPLALGNPSLSGSLYQLLGLDTKLLDLMSSRLPADASKFFSEFPSFTLKPMIEYFPVMLDYAQKHLLHPNESTSTPS